MVTKLKIAIIAVVAIAAIVGITLGIVYGTRSNDDDETSCDIFNAPILELSVIDDRLVASWTEPDNLNDCSVTYNLKYTIDGGSQVSIELKETQFKFEDLELEPCTEVTVILTAVNKDGYSSSPVRETFTKEVDTEFAAVLGLTIISTGDFDILATWIGLAGFEKCDLSYKVTVGKDTTILDGLEHAATVGYCTTTITVVPVIGEVEGILVSEQVTIDVEEGFLSIYGMEAERFDVFLEAIWERLPAFDACDIIFRVTLNDAEEQETTRLEIRFDLPDETCVDHTIEVTPTIGEIRGSPLSETVHIGGCPKNLHGST